MTLLTIMKMLHLVGLVMGFGGAVAADLLILRRAALTPIRAHTIRQAKILSHAVFAGLGLLWASGAALVWIRAAADPHFLLNEKLWAKVAIVIILTINGAAVHRFALGHVAQRVGLRLFDNLSANALAGLALIGAISSVSWFAPFLLGTAAELNFKVKMEDVLSVYAMAVVAAWLVIFTVASRFSSSAPEAEPSFDMRATG